MAIALAKEHVEERLPEVVTAVAGRLFEMECYEAAGELYEDINAMKEVQFLYLHKVPFQGFIT